MGGGSLLVIVDGVVEVDGDVMLILDGVNDDYVFDGKFYDYMLIFVIEVVIFFKDVISFMYDFWVRYNLLVF